MGANLEKELVPPLIRMCRDLPKLYRDAMKAAYERPGNHLNAAVDGIAKTDAERLEHSVAVDEGKAVAEVGGSHGASDSGGVDDALSAIASDPKKAARYEQYLARKKAEGKQPWTPEQWSKAYDRNGGQVARGNKFRNDVLDALSLKHQQDGWRNELPTTDAKEEERRLDFGNRQLTQGFEFKSGSTPTKEAMDQLRRDEKLVRSGWQVVWVMNKKLTVKVMEELSRMKDLYPGFDYHVVGP